MRLNLLPDAAGTPHLPFGHASVTLSNAGNEPIKLWRLSSRQGWGMLTLRYTNSRGQVFLAWRANPRWWEAKDLTEDTFVVPAHSEAHFTFGLSGTTGPRNNLPAWYGLPEPNTDEEYTLVAILDIQASDETKKRRVWSGRITSEAVEGTVVDESLNSPDEYMRAGYPKRALAMMQQDPGWLARNDAAPLRIAAQYASEGSKDVIAWLLGTGIDINSGARENGSPLYFAADARTVAFLLRYRPDLRSVHRVGSEVSSPLEEMARRMENEFDDQEEARRCFRLILDAGAEYDLRSAIRLNDLDRVQELAKMQPEAILQSLGALRLAAKRGHARICKVLLELGADPEDLEGGSGISILASACKYADVVKVLLEGGAKANTRLKFLGGQTGMVVVEDNATALHYAAEAGEVESARLLLDRGADIEALDEDGNSPLHIAAIMSRYKMVAFLLSRGARIDVKNDAGDTPMTFAKDAAMGKVSESDGVTDKNKTIEMLQKAQAK